MLRETARRLVRRLGYDLVPREHGFPQDFDHEAIETIRRVEPYTMTGLERVFALIQAVRYVVRADIPGSIVECGVWRGGSMMAAAYTLKQLGKSDRDLCLFDTFEGMSEPTDVDISLKGEPASVRYERAERTSEGLRWCYASIEEVRKNMHDTGYSQARVSFAKGKVEDTIPGHAPSQISILRLDTDWYESTLHELTHLYPRLAPGGVLIVDDYGHWLGARKAVDEYFAASEMSVLLTRVDYTGVVAVKR
jgi:O-methyltransferase